tara:strand:+ start:329 stop:721 length:393 start_codon:yes stop_codon:yes gene_type:complete
MITKTIAQLIEEDVITLEQFHEAILKNKRIKKRNLKKSRNKLVKEKVCSALKILLEKPGATVKHRTVWNFIGRDEYTRDEILVALRSLRSDGILQNIKTSNNNFQVFWAYVKQPEAEKFCTLNNIADKEC